MELISFKTIDGIEIFENVNLEKYTTIKLGAIGTIAFAKTLEALKELITKLRNKKINYHVVGWGANQVLLNCDNTLFIKLDFEFDRELFKEVHPEYYFPASVPLNQLSSHATKFGLKGWEVFTGIPASFGGAIFMNAGTALGEIGDLIKSVDIMRTNGEVYTYKCNKDSFSYRKNNFVKDGEIIIGGVIEHKGTSPEISEKIKSYLEYRKSSQPLRTKNCGSVFKNVSNQYRAGVSIDTVGLKGFGVKNLMVSDMHANFIENKGNAKSDDFKSLTDSLKQELERYTGLAFELEVKIY